VIKADANRQRGVPGPEAHWNKTTPLTRPVREYLEALDAAQEERTPPKNVSLTDPASQWTAAPGGPAFFAYSTHYLVDTKAGVIVDVEASPAHRTAEVNATRTMLERTEVRMGMKPERLMGDTAYGSAPMREWLVEKQGIEPHVPVWDKSDRSDGTFSRSEFAWNEQGNTYSCPGGKALRSNWRAFKVPRTGVTKTDTIIYRASEHDCRDCSLKEQCCPSTPMRKIARSIHEHAREVARKIATTPQYLRSRCERKKVEMLFAHLKRILRLDRLRLRGLHGAHDEFLMAAIAQNLRRMAKRLMPTMQEEAKGLPA
jgi:Transposase DDE domain